MAVLTLEQASRENQNGDAAATTALHLSHRVLSDVSCLGGGAFQNLERLDLSYNCLTTLEGLSSCSSLKWLSVVENKLVSLKGIEGLTRLTVIGASLPVSYLQRFFRRVERTSPCSVNNIFLDSIVLQVFNAGKNKLTRMDEITSVTTLQALILNDNNISSICKLGQLKLLNTLVLSRNPIYDIGHSLMKATSITKLSLSHCQIEKIGSSLMACADLKEARFSHNKITTLPTELAQNVKLQILDLGNNLIENLSELKVLSAFHNLKNLNLQGNPVAEKDKLIKKVSKLLPGLRIFNAKPIELGNTREKISGKETLIRSKDEHPIPNVFDVEAEKEAKRNKSKIDLEVSGVSISKKFSKEAQVPHSPTELEVQKKSKRKKLDKDADIPKKSISIQTKDKISTQNDTDHRAIKKSKRKPESEESKFKGIDDAETPFMDLILSDKNLQESDRKKENPKVAPDAKPLGGLVVNHNRNKKTKNVGTGQKALELLPPAPEVGMGGPSMWDD